MCCRVCAGTEVCSALVKNDGRSEGLSQVFVNIPENY